ncbi:hypothetical protein ACFVRD_27610 [Streptomyces sp. NPDC057908]|uniref:hypothetical protein n=1 Tax=Streptomyces sp. NPDC057908 TaxID=3346276 RepID=UPI0036E21EDD
MRPTLTVGTALLVVPLVVLYRSPLRALRQMPVTSPNSPNQGGNSLNVSSSTGARAAGRRREGGAGAVKSVIGAHLFLEREGSTLLSLRHASVAFAGGEWHALAGHVE